VGCTVLIRFRVRNFRSLKEEQELSLVASSLKETPEAVTRVEALNLGLLRAAAIYGANASGKTNVVKAFEYMSSAVCNSQRRWSPEGPIPREPFLLDPKSKDDSSSFEVDVVLDGVRLHYGFMLNDREILGEWLDAYPRGRRQIWFRREAKTFSFGKNLTGDNRAVQIVTRPNSLFLSAAAQNNHEALLPLYRWFADRLTYVPGERWARSFLHWKTAEMCQSEGFRHALQHVLRAADLGVMGVDVRLEDAFSLPPGGIDSPVRALMEKVMGQLRELAAQVGVEDRTRAALWDKRPVLALIHKGSAGDGVALGEGDESAGTLAFFGLLGPVLCATRSGGTVCVDELDASMHPLLALELVRIFNDPKRNPHGAQVVFTTHDTNILAQAPLRRDQIWFTEKDTVGATHLYPLTDFKPRNNENLERGYLQGRYGAVPFIGPTDFLADIHRERGER
jgi:hypothetical protein